MRAVSALVCAVFVLSLFDVFLVSAAGVIWGDFGPRHVN